MEEVPKASKKQDAWAPPATAESLSIPPEGTPTPDFLLGFTRLAFVGGDIIYKASGAFKVRVTFS